MQKEREKECMRTHAGQVGGGGREEREQASEQAHAWEREKQRAHALGGERDSALAPPFI